MSRNDTAHAFFDACETGKGWEVCQDWCHADATFSCQADALADTITLAAYSEWMKGLLTPIPDGRVELSSQRQSFTEPSPARVGPSPQLASPLSRTTPMSWNSMAIRYAT